MGMFLFVKFHRWNLVLKGCNVTEKSYEDFFLLLLFSVLQDCFVKGCTKEMLCRRFYPQVTIPVSAITFFSISLLHNLLL